MKFLNSKPTVPLDNLTDTPSRLFRRIAVDELNVKIPLWKTHMDDYIRKLHPDRLQDMESVKRERSTTIGNINDTLWLKPTLTFKKFLTGLKILKATKVRIIVEVDFKSGKKVVVSEDINMTDYRDDGR